MKKSTKKNLRIKSLKTLRKNFRKKTSEKSLKKSLSKETGNPVSFFYFDKT